MQYTSVELGYTERNVLRDLSVTMKRGEFVFLIGASGSWKTSFIRSLVGELPPKSGTILTDEWKDLYTLNKKELSLYRRKIGVVFQDFKLLESRTVRENVAFAMEVSGYKDSVISSRIPEVLTEVGLLSKIDTRVTELSGWEAQRIGIARALIHNPTILIGDEPTGNLDPKNAFEIINIFERLNKEGRTIIISTHDAAIVDHFKKRVLEFGRGTIIRDVNPWTYVWSTP